MRKKHFILLLLAVLCLMLLLAACNNGGEESPTGTPASSPAASGPLPAEGLPEHWSADGENIVFDGQDWESCYLSSLTLSDNDFRHSADVVFADQDKGLAALIFQSSADRNDCYAASISALTNE